VVLLYASLLMANTMLYRMVKVFSPGLFASQFIVASVYADDSQFIKFSSDSLLQGRELWIENCEGCHAYGIAGAPVPMRPADWKNRVTKPMDVLYDHAINGFFGEDDTMMPERGGNPELSDKQLKLAVDYMHSLATYYINSTN